MSPPTACAVRNTTRRSLPHILSRPLQYLFRAPRERSDLMLTRNKDKDGALKVMRSFEENFNRWFHYPVAFLNDKDWDKRFMDAVSEVVSGNVPFHVIPKHMWSFPSWIDKDAILAL